jgi:hypothetical protein
VSRFARALRVLQWTRARDVARQSVHAITVPLEDLVLRLLRAYSVATAFCHRGASPSRSPTDPKADSRRTLPGVLLLSAALASCSGDSRAADEQASPAAPPPASAETRTGTDSAAAAAVVAAMHRVYAAFKTQDTAAGNAELSAAGMVYMDHQGIVPLTNPQGTSEMFRMCLIRSYAMDSVRTASPGPGVMLLAFKLTIDETCGDRRTLSPGYALSTWHQEGGAWKLAAFAGAAAVGAR